MIKFFRRIRRQLLAKNKFRKYLLYAIGEIALIVIGIIIALWLNTLNQEKNIKKEEISILKELKVDFQLDVEDFKVNVSFYKRIISSIDYILKKMESNEVYNDSLNSAFAHSTGWPLSTIHSSSFDVLTGKGFELISNDSLRRKVIYMHNTNYQNILNWENPKIRQTYMKEILFRFDKIQAWSYNDDGKFYFGKMTPIDYQSLKNDELYKSILNSIRNDAEFLLNGRYWNLINEIEKLIEDIDTELKILEN